MVNIASSILFEVIKVLRKEFKINTEYQVFQVNMGIVLLFRIEKFELYP